MTALIGNTRNQSTPQQLQPDCLPIRDIKLIPGGLPPTTNNPAYAKATAGQKGGLPLRSPAKAGRRGVNK